MDSLKQYIVWFCWLISSLIQLKRLQYSNKVRKQDNHISNGLGNNNHISNGLGNNK
jgi:hypothetical protein